MVVFLWVLDGGCTWLSGGNLWRDVLVLGFRIPFLITRFS